jgi:outer membrane lipoprotein-sorting protein
MRFLDKLILPIACLVGLIPISIAAATETLDSVLGRAAAQQQTVIDYREVRHMQLLSQVWQAEGRIYLSGFSFIINQLSPQKQLLVADRTRIWLLDPKRNIRRSMMMTAPMAQKSFSFIMPIIQGDRKSLEKHFNIAFSDEQGEWRIKLVPKRGEESQYSHIILSGPNGKAAERMRTESYDGDSSNWFFSQQSFSDETQKQVEQLIREAKGI